MASRNLGTGVLLLVVAACAGPVEPERLGRIGSTTPGSSGGDDASGAGSNTTGSVGAGGASAGTGPSSALTGATGGSAGSAGQHGGNPLGGSSGTPGAGGASGNPGCGTCEPVGVRMHEASNMALQGNTIGGSGYVDVCNDDEALVGLSWEFGDHTTYPGNPRVLSLRAVCAPLVLSSDGHGVQTSAARELPERGSSGISGASVGTTPGPAGQVIVALGSRFGDAAAISNTTIGAIKEITLQSASITFPDGIAQTGTENALPPIGAGQDGDTTNPLTACPAGQVARGAQIRSGAWVDALGLICGTPLLTYPAGAPCTGDETCASGSCASFCQP